MSDLTVAEFRTHVSTSLIDAAVQLYIDAVEQQLRSRLGPVGNVTETRFLRGERVILLGREPAPIVSVAELADDGVTLRTLASTDYIVVGKTLRRLDTGPNPPDLWASRTTIIYTPFDDLNARKVATIKLVALDVQEKDAGAVTSRTVGQHAVTYADPADRVSARKAIWDELEDYGLPFFA